MKLIGGSPFNFLDREVPLKLSEGVDKSIKSSYNHPWIALI